MTSAQKPEKTNGASPPPPKTFEKTAPRRIGRGELAVLFARVLPQMPETFSREDLERRVFETTGERYEVGDVHNAVQFLKEKDVMKAVGRGTYRIEEDVRQGKRTLVAAVRLSPEALEREKTKAREASAAEKPAEKPVKNSAAMAVAAPITNVQPPESSAPAVPSISTAKDVRTAISALANTLVLTDVEQEEKEIGQILEAISLWEAHVRRRQKAVQVRKEMMAMLG